MIDISLECWPKKYKGKETVYVAYKHHKLEGHNNNMSTPPTPPMYKCVMR